MAEPAGLLAPKERKSAMGDGCSISIFLSTDFANFHELMATPFRSDFPSD